MPNRGITTCAKCGEEKKYHSKGLCETCYNQYRRRLIICANCGKLKKRYRKTLCSSCYRQQNICSCARCSKKKPHYAKGLCRVCYSREGAPLIICIKCGKRKPHQAKNMCSSCYHHENNKKRQEKKAIYWQQWQKENPEKVARGLARRRARKGSLPDTLTLKENKELLIIRRSTYPRKKLVLDHFIPLGAKRNVACGTTRANMHYIPASLNLTKNVKPPEEVYKQLNFL